MNRLQGFYGSVQQAIINHRKSISFVIFLVEAALANFLAFVLRFDGVIPHRQFGNFIAYLPVLLIIRGGLFLAGGLHKNLLRYSSIPDLVDIIKMTLLSSAIFAVLVRFVLADAHYPRTIYIIDSVLLIMISGGTRLLIRVFREYMQSAIKGRKLLIIGAGDAAEMIVRDIKHNAKYDYTPIGFIDDDPQKKGLKIHGIPIFGPREMLSAVISKEQPDEVLIAIPSAGRKFVQEVFAACKPYQLPVKTLPRLSDIFDGTVTVSQIRPLDLEDLLQRDQVSTDNRGIHAYVTGKTVLVTGAGGSIGSELARQLHSYGPATLILFDRYENGLFDIDRELRENPEKQAGLTDVQKTQLVTVVADMTNRQDVELLFRERRPDVVFHAAAHKHVPLMEANPLEAVRNNVFGTLNLIECAHDNHAGNFVMISTDKAVSPTSVMGATKRVAELMTLSMHAQSSTKFTTVRFGNVLGSRGSVVNIFREQLKKGGPLTVTHPEIRRFFMLVPEAVHLVLTAAASGKGGEIFVLDMGEQLRIAELAENLIRLSGYTPGEDIKIEYIGLRPGEKMYEELFNADEKVAPTDHEKLLFAIPKTMPSTGEIASHLARLREGLSTNSAEELLRELHLLVPNFVRPTASLNEQE